MNERPALSAERAAYLRKIRRETLLVRGSRAAIVFVFFALWEIAADTGLIDAFIMSSPSRIAATTARLAAEGNLFSTLA